MMQTMLRRLLPVAAAVVLGATMFSAAPAQAQYGRQYYTTWSYYPTYGYYYTYYRYQPTYTTTTYSYHYCTYYPSRPRYVYYYNPVRRVYWGRYDLEEQGYSLLEEKDRKENLDDIPETAFPKPGKMPNVPEATDALAMDKPPAVPSTTPPKDAPTDTPKK
jgi:hypothetical protein